MAAVQGDKAKRNQWTNLMNFNSSKNKKHLGDNHEVYSIPNKHTDIIDNKLKITNSSVKQVSVMYDIKRFENDGRYGYELTIDSNIKFFDDDITGNTLASIIVKICDTVILKKDINLE